MDIVQILTVTFAIVGGLLGLLIGRNLSNTIMGIIYGAIIFLCFFVVSLFFSYPFKYPKESLSFLIEIAQIGGFFIICCIIFILILLSGRLLDQWSPSFRRRKFSKRRPSAKNDAIYSLETLSIFPDWELKQKQVDYCLLSDEDVLKPSVAKTYYDKFKGCFSYEEQPLLKKYLDNPCDKTALEFLTNCKIYANEAFKIVRNKTDEITWLAFNKKSTNFLSIGHMFDHIDKKTINHCRLFLAAYIGDINKETALSLDADTLFEKVLIKVEETFIQHIKASQDVVSTVTDRALLNNHEFVPQLYSVYCRIKFPDKNLSYRAIELCHRSVISDIYKMTSDHGLKNFKYYSKLKKVINYLLTLSLFLSAPIFTIVKLWQDFFLASIIFGCMVLGLIFLITNNMFLRIHYRTWVLGD